MDPETVLYVSFNALPLNQPTIARLEQLVQSYAQAGKLTAAQITFYSALLSFARGEVTGYTDQITSLQHTDYHARYVRLEEIKAQVYGFVDPPAYYLEGMIGLELFSK